MEAFLRDPAFGWDYARMVHGDQSFTLHRPMYAGDELVTTVHVDELRHPRRAATCSRCAARSRDAAGEAVLTAAR